MDLKEILAISGAPGLFKYVAQGKGGIVVESLIDSRRTMVNGATKVSALGDIAIFTDSEEVALSDILQAIFDQNQGATVEINAKSTPEELHSFMNQALPNYDRERVHNSDIKKVALWYNILVGAGMTTFKIEKNEDEDGQKIVKAKTDTDSVAKKTAAMAATPKVSAAASRPKVVAPKSTTNRKSGS